MAKLGALPSNQGMPAAEFMTGGNWSNVIANLGSLTFEVGRYTTPWPCTVHARLYTSYYFAGHQQVGTDAALSTPAPDWSPGLNTISVNATTDVHTQITWARWTGLAGGALIVANVRVAVGGGGVGVQGDRYAITFRAIRT
jgi:hypothetical protein